MHRKIITGSCPKCGSQRLHWSRCRNVVERAVALLGGDMRRCHECNTRFARAGESLVRTGDLKAVSQKFYLAVTMALAVVAVMAAIIWFAHLQTAQGVDTGSLALPWRGSLILG